MATINTSDIKNGITLKMDNNLLTVVEFQHVKPGKGGAFVRTKLRNLRTAAVIERTFNASEKLEQAIIEKSDVQYLYRDGDDFIFMDNDTYDQTPVSSQSLGDVASYLKPNGTAMIVACEGEIIGIELPASVELTITETEPGVQGDRVSGASKPATLETGLVVQVPLFIDAGETIKVDTRSGEYMARVK